MNIPFLIVILALGALAVAPMSGNAGDVVLAQGSPPLKEPDSPLNKVTANRSIIRAQVELGINYESRALATLRASADPGSVDEAIRNIRLGYYQLRYAASGVELLLEGRKTRRIPDPLLEMTDKAIQGAMEHVRYALTAAQYLASDSSRLPSALERLQAAVESAGQALDLL